METPIVINEVNHPMDVLQMFDTSKEKIKLFADLIIDEVKEGRVDPLKIKALCKSMEQVIEFINDNTKDEQTRAAQKFPSGKFNAFGCEMEYTSTYTKYDYSKCNDPAWEEYSHAEQSNANNRKQREKFLQAMTSPLTMVDDRTGEIITVTPPVKTQTMGVKVTIK